MLRAALGEEGSQGLHHWADLAAVGADQAERHRFARPFRAKPQQPSGPEVIRDVERRLAGDAMPGQGPKMSTPSVIKASTGMPSTTATT